MPKGRKKQNRGPKQKRIRKKRNERKLCEQLSHAFDTLFNLHNATAGSVGVAGGGRS